MFLSVIDADAKVGDNEEKIGVIEMLYELLGAYAAGDTMAMHMPGHKRNAALAPYLCALGAGIDITEIDGFDNLHAPEGLLKEAQAHAAQLWGTVESYFLVNGSSGGILAGIHAAARRGDEILLTRGAHKSVFHAIELCGLIPHFLMPNCVGNTSIFASITPDSVKTALETNPKIKLVVLTSPTYEGVISDIASIAEICHTHGVPLMVDEAHGAHLGLGGGFADGAVRCGADLVVQSVHKTLPSLTQTAILHRCSDRIDADRLRHALAVFQTSSPSYLLMASIDGCCTLLQKQPELLENWYKTLRKFEENTQGLKNIRFFLRNETAGVFARDPSKIVFASKGIRGDRLAEILRREHRIELEMASPGYALAMTGLGDKEETLARFTEALYALDTLAPCDEDFDFLAEASLYQMMPKLDCLPGEALDMPHQQVPLADCAGHIAAEYIWAYPPGIPLVIPGEQIDTALAEALQKAAAIPGRLHASFSDLTNGLSVIK